MGSVIKSISVSEDESAFLKDYSLSPSQLIKEKIWEMKGMIRNLTGDKIARMAKLIQVQAQKIEDLENVGIE